MKAKALKLFLSRATGLMRQPILPHVEYMLITDGFINVFNLSTHYRMPIDCDKQLLVPYKELKKIVSSLEADDNVTFDRHTDESIPTCNVLINGQPLFNFNHGYLIEDFPKFFELRPMEMDPILMVSESMCLTLRNMLKYTSKDQLRPALCEMFFDRGCAVVTDGHKLVYQPLDEYGDVEENDDRPFLVSKAVVRLMRGNITLSHRFNGERDFISFTPDDGLKSEVIHRCTDENIPKWQTVLPVHEKFATVNRSQFLRELKLAMITANETTHQIRVQIKPSGIRLNSEDLDYGSSYTGTKLKIDTQQSEPFTFGINGEFLADLLKFVKADELLKIEYSEPNRGLIFNERILLMPVMLNEHSYA